MDFKFIYKNYFYFDCYLKILYCSKLMYLNTLITRPFLSIYGTNIVGHMGYTNYHYHNHIQSFYKTPTTYTASTPTAMVPQWGRTPMSVVSIRLTPMGTLFLQAMPTIWTMARGETIGLTSLTFSTTITTSLPLRVIGTF